MRKGVEHAAALFVVAIAVAACGGSDDSTGHHGPAASAGDQRRGTGRLGRRHHGRRGSTDSSRNCGTTVDEIAAEAKKEGQVNLIALPDTWANYKGILDSFKSTVRASRRPSPTPTPRRPTSSTAITTLRGQPDMPEVVDVGPSFTTQMVDKGYCRDLQAAPSGTRSRTT